MFLVLCVVVIVAAFDTFRARTFFSNRLTYITFFHVKVTLAALDLFERKRPQLSPAVHASGVTDSRCKAAGTRPTPGSPSSDALHDAKLTDALIYCYSCEIRSRTEEGEGEDFGCDAAELQLQIPREGRRRRA